MKRILFICTGNTCRSPMAEAIFRSLVGRAGLDFEVRSAGVSAWNGVPISDHSEAVLRKKGIQDHLTSSSVDAEAIRWADLILTMTVSHKRNVIQRFPEVVDKVYTLKEYVEDDASVLHNIAEREKLYTEWQIKKALSQDLSAEEQMKLNQLERSMPNFDIADPFGGSLKEYEECAQEIERALEKLIRKIGNSDTE